MARKVVKEVLAENIEGNAAVLSSQEFADLLGSADDLVFQVTTTRVSGTNPTITLKYHHSNDGKRFYLKTTILDGVGISEGFTRVSDAIGGGGALGQVEVQLGAGDTPGAFVTVVACGRVH